MQEFNFCINDRLAEEFADHRSRLSSPRMDETATHKPKWYEKVDPKFVKVGVTQRLQVVLTEFARKVRDLPGKSLEITTGSEFTAELGFREVVRKGVRIARSRKGKGLQWDLARQFNSWVIQKDRIQLTSGAVLVGYVSSDHSCVRLVTGTGEVESIK